MMQRASAGFRRPRTKILVGLVSLALVVAACGGDDDSAKATAPSSSPSSGTPTDTSNGTGVTAGSIKVGISMVDFDAIKQFVDFNHGNQRKAYEAFIADINAHGGINGRKLVPVYESFSPIGSAGASGVCTSMTEDQKVFAIVGGFIDLTGAAQICVSKNHHTILVTHELSQDLIGKAPQALLLTPDITPERRIDVLMTLLKRKGTLKGKKVAIVAETGTQSRINSTIKPALDDMGVEQGSTAVIATGTNPDTTAAQAQLASFLERWKSEGVDAIVISGLAIVAKNFVEMIKAQLPDALLMTDAESSAKEGGQDEVKAGKKPNPYDGMMTVIGYTDQQTFETPSVQKCVSTYEKATGDKVVSPDDLKPDKNGKRVEVYQAVEDACGELTFFKLLATRTGKYLNNANWTNAVNHYGSMNGQLVGSNFGSIKTGKYDADNGFRLVEFDPNASGNGNWKPLTSIQDAAAG